MHFACLVKYVVFTWSERSTGRIACLPGNENMLHMHNLLAKEQTTWSSYFWNKKL
jgi:hypothetical protein